MFFLFDKFVFFVYVDMDSFKWVNDILGYLVGDYCLVEIGWCLWEVSCGFGIFYRWGGDEFVIFVLLLEFDLNEFCECV